jgi:hypothetical protein
MFKTRIDATWTRLSTLGVHLVRHLNCQCSAATHSVTQLHSDKHPIIQVQLFRFPFYPILLLLLFHLHLDSRRSTSRISTSVSSPDSFGCVISLGFSSARGCFLGGLESRIAIMVRFGPLYISLPAALRCWSIYPANTPKCIPKRILM